MSVIARNTRPRSVLCTALLAIALPLFLGGEALAASPSGMTGAAQGAVAAVAPIKQKATGTVKATVKQARTVAKPVLHPVAAATAPVRAQARAAAQPVVNRARPVVHTATQAVHPPAGSRHGHGAASHRRIGNAAASAHSGASRQAGTATAGTPRADATTAPFGRYAAAAKAERQDASSTAASGSSHDSNPFGVGSPGSPLSGGPLTITLFLLAGLLTALLLMGAPGLGGRIRLAVAVGPMPDLALSVERPG
jgi:hypothetical protein